MKNHDAGPAISIRNLRYRYGNQAALENIDLDIAAGRFTVVLGKNGSGKSTLFRLIAGFLQSNEGEISISAVRLQPFPTGSVPGFSAFCRSTTDRCFLSPSSMSSLPVVPAMSCSHLKRRTDCSPMKPWPASVSTALERRLFTELSGGEQQLVMLARILAQKPQIILLDEPISHLDFAYQAKVMELSANWSASRSLLSPFSTIRISPLSMETILSV